MNYTQEDVNCSHCGGKLSNHWEGRLIRWCDDCGSNDKDSPPNVSVTFTP